MKEEVSCEYKDTVGLLQKFEKSCYGSIKSKNFFGGGFASLGDIKGRGWGKLPQMR